MAVIRQIVSNRELSFRETLEERARLVARARQTPRWDSEWGATAVLERRIAVTLDDLDGARVLRKRQLQSLLRVECYTDTELMQMEQRTPTYSPYRFPERAKLQRRLLKIERERRQLSTQHEDRMQTLHRELLGLLEQHAQLPRSP